MALANICRLSCLGPAVTRMACSPALRINSRMPIAPMATSAQEQMKTFWEKNQKLNRPSSPWMVYKFHLPMATSLTFRLTSVAMGVVLYGAAIGVYLSPGDFAGIVEALKATSIPAPAWFVLKTLAAFPLVFHYIGGVRHLFWDMGKGLRIPTVMKTSWFLVVASVILSAFLASLAYIH